MKRKTILAACALVSSLPLGAHAQAPAQEMRLNMDSGIYIGAGGGRSRSGDRCVGVCDTTDKTWTVYGGYQFNRFFALETGYSDFGQATTSGTLFGLPVTARIDTTAWEFLAVGSLPMTDKFSVYGKFGVFRYYSDASTTGATVGTSSARGTEYTIGGGLQYVFAGNFAGRLEWQRYNDVGSGTPGLEKDFISVWRVTGRYKF
jgi:OOP family OmpA-OmpF porin